METHKKGAKRAVLDKVLNGRASGSHWLGAVFLFGTVIYSKYILYSNSHLITAGILQTFQVGPTPLRLEPLYIKVPTTTTAVSY